MAFARVSSALALALGVILVGHAQAAPPDRVVSLNVCTDQLAMLLAAPGQLVAVSHLARDPMSSVMADEAMSYPVTYGQAEEVFLLRPDLVLAGTYTTRATVDLLRRLGIPVEQFPPPSSLADIAAQMRAVGAAMGREDQGERLARDFEAGLAELVASAGQAPPSAALYGANGYSGGTGTLSGEILEAGGFRNIARDLGRDSGGYLPLEQLILAGPDIVLSGQPYPGSSRAEEILRHPALAGFRRGEGSMVDAEWVCGTPKVLDAIARLGALAREVGG